MSNRQQLFPRGACLSRDRHACNFSWERSRGVRQTSQPRLLVLLFLSSRCSHHTRPLLVTVIFICDRGFIVRELIWPTLWVWHCVSLVNYHRRQLRLYNWRAVIMDWKFGLLFACLLVDGEWFCEVLTGVYAFMIHYAIYKGRFLTANVLCHSVPQLDTIIACIWSY